MKLSVTKRGMVQTSLGSIFYLLNDGRRTPQKGIEEKLPILCFHMSPRSSDEYLEVLPLLASSGEASIEENDEYSSINGRVVIAFDIPGYGASENPPRSCTVDEISDAILMAADSILLSSEEKRNNEEEDEKNCSRNYITVGSLLGNFFCVSLASRYPERIKAVILTNPWYNPDAITTDSLSFSESKVALEDTFTLKDDGSHLVDLHSKRSGWLDPELNLRVVASEIAYLTNRRVRYPMGINLPGANDYNFQTSMLKITENNAQRGKNGDSITNFLYILGESCATLFDQYGLVGTKRFEEACNLLIPGDNDDDATTSNNNDNSIVVRVERLLGEKSTLNVVNQMPEEFAALCNKFLTDCGL